MDVIEFHNLETPSLERNVRGGVMFGHLED